MRKLTNVLMALAAFVAAVSCAPKPQYANRAEKILAEINDPNSKYVVVISHRGDWRNYPENSIPAIESIIRMGVDMMELDVKMTKDSVLVLMHDQTIKSIAYTHTTSLAIGNDSTTFFHISIFIKICMTYTCSCLYHWHPRIIPNV